MAHLQTPSPELIARIRRIAGQVAAIERGLESGANCTDILHLTAAVRGAVNGFLDEVVVHHLDQHVSKPDLSDEARAQGAEDLKTVIRRYAK